MDPELLSPMINPRSLNLDMARSYKSILSILYFWIASENSISDNGSLSLAFLQSKLIPSSIAMQDSAVFDTAMINTKTCKNI